MIRSVVRHPNIFTTPKALATELGVLTRVPRPGRMGDFTRDFFMSFPDPRLVANGGRDYKMLYDFYSATKSKQRRLLDEAGIPVPKMLATSSPPFVVRPLRHMQGHGYRLTDRRGDYNPEREYIAPIFPKTNEYRIFYIYGELALLLTKKPNEGIRLRPEDPWNHGNTSFHTIDDIDRSNLRVHTNAFDLLSRCPYIAKSHYVGVDVLYNRNTHDWTVCEFNSSPALQIEANLQKVAGVIREH